jgi:hypothetical protein
VDEYETCRPPRRSAYEMIMTRNERHRLLSKEWDITQNQMAAAIRTVFRIKCQRRVTFNRCCGSAEKFDEFVENASRSLRKIFLGQSTSIQVAELDRQYQKAQRLRLQLWKEEIAAQKEVNPKDEVDNGHLNNKSRPSGNSRKNLSSNNAAVDRFNMDKLNNNIPPNRSLEASTGTGSIIANFGGKENNRNSSISSDDKNSKLSANVDKKYPSDTIYSPQQQLVQQGQSLKDNHKTSVTARSTTAATTSNKHRWDDNREYLVQKYSNLSTESTYKNQHQKETRNDVVTRIETVEIPQESAINKNSNNSMSSKTYQPPFSNNFTNIRVTKTTTSSGSLTYEEPKYYTGSHMNSSNNSDRSWMNKADRESNDHYTTFTEL